MKDCDDQHTICDRHRNLACVLTKRRLPTRLLQIGSAQQRPSLHVCSADEIVRYAALSHCWGRTPQCKTLRGNLARHVIGIEFEALSRTFQDAILVTRELGLEYIWIDSLCIIQDDAEDWRKESARMGDIYMNAYITIAATCSADGDGGLNRCRESSQWLRLPCDGTDTGAHEKGFMWLSDSARTSQAELDDAPLNSRAWVYQEKILSSRIVHFAASQVYWECKQLFVGQEYEDRLHNPGKTMEFAQVWRDINQMSLRSVPQRRRNFVRTKAIRNASWTNSPIESLLQSWRMLVSFYSTRQLTQASDRLIALQGIINIWETKTGLRCIDGHWDNGFWHFVRELLWFRQGPRCMPSKPSGQRARLCSSWSWASLEGPIEYKHDDPWMGIVPWQRYGLEDCNLYLRQIDSWCCEPWPHHPLSVCGVLVAARALHGNDENTQNDTYLASLSRLNFTMDVDHSDEAIGLVYFDRQDRKLDHFLITPVCLLDRGRKVAFLALAEVSGMKSGKPPYERIGIGYLGVVRSEGFEEPVKIPSLEAYARRTFRII